MPGSLQNELTPEQQNKITGKRSGNFKCALLLSD